MKHTYSNEQVIEALKNAPYPNDSELFMMWLKPEKLKGLKDIPHLKALWVLTHYSRMWACCFIADSDIPDIWGREFLNLTMAILECAPHERCYGLAEEVLAKENNTHSEITEEKIQKEIMAGRVRKLYIGEEWREKNG